MAWDDPSVWFAGTSALFAGLSAGFTFWQAREARLTRVDNQKTLNDQAEAGRLTLEAANRSAEAAYKGVALATRELEVGNRPWVIVRSIRGKKHGAVAK